LGPKLVFLAILVVNWVSSCLSFSPSASSAATYIFSAPTCTTTIITLKPRALDAEFQHFILRFNKISLLCQYHWKTVEGVKAGPKDRVTSQITLLTLTFTQDNFKNKFRPPNPVAPLAKRKRNSGLHTTLIFCWTLKKVIPLYHFHWYFKLLTNLSNTVTHLIVSSLKITKIQNSNHQIQQFHWSNHLFCTPTHKPIQTPSM
jgi:hypothetical protein